ncbi:hypothetical protein Unana1_06966 [Umbelopsis nana]
MEEMNGNSIKTLISTTSAPSSEKTSVSAIKSDIILDHDDIVGDIQEKNAQYYQVIGVLAGDGFSDQTNSRMGIGVEAIHVLDLIQLLRSVGVQNPVLQSEKWKRNYVFLRWTCRDSSFYHRYRKLGLGSSKLFDTDSQKVEAWLDQDWKIINFFWGMFEADGYIVPSRLLLDGSRERLRSIANGLGFAKPEDINIVKLSESSCHINEIFALNIPARISLCLAEQLQQKFPIALPPMAKLVINVGNYLPCGKYSFSGNVCVGQR